MTSSTFRGRIPVAAGSSESIRLSSSTAPRSAGIGWTDQQGLLQQVQRRGLAAARTSHIAGVGASRYLGVDPTSARVAAPAFSRSPLRAMPGTGCDAGADGSIGRCGRENKDWQFRGSQAVTTAPVRSLERWIPEQEPPAMSPGTFSRRRNRSRWRALRRRCAAQRGDQCLAQHDQRRLEHRHRGGCETDPDAS